MEVLLLRHGKAEPHGHPGGDSERGLVVKGYEQARRAGHYLRATGMLPEIIITSPLLRAKQTAEAFSRAAQLPGPVVQSWLGIGMHPDIALRELSSFIEFQRVCLVGHEPDFSSLIAWVTNGEGGAVEVRKGSLTMLDLKPPSRSGILRFVIPQRMMQPVLGEVSGEDDA
ncbi:MAG: phosphohistidine phosphatase SixA [Verrucomicrobiota bacterium]|jgi:phosphohistidine phosphatase